MKKVLLVALLAVAVATPVWAQNPPPAPVAPPPRPAQAPPAAPAAQAAPAPPPAPAAPRPGQRPATPARAATVPAPPAAPEPPRVPRNVRFEITITDTAGGKPVTKTLSVTVSDSNGNGSIRSMGAGTTIANPIPLNIDVRNVVWQNDSVVRAAVNVEYQAYIADAKQQPGMVTATANSVFQDGRRTQILQAADPTSDRRTTIEVTATILK